jgi:hypothetical protein
MGWETDVQAFFAAFLSRILEDLSELEAAFLTPGVE